MVTPDDGAEAHLGLLLPYLADCNLLTSVLERVRKQSAGTAAKAGGMGAGNLNPPGGLGAHHPGP
jgi:hypothetical protein